MFLKDLHGEQKHVIEVHRVLQFQKLLIPFIDLRKTQFFRGIFPGKGICRRDHAVLAAADVGLHGTGGDFFLGVPEFRRRLPDDTGLVRRIGNGKMTVIVSRFSDIAPEDPSANGVKCPQGDFLCIFGTDQPFHTFPHFPGGFIGECDPEDMLRGDPL